RRPAQPPSPYRRRTEAAFSGRLRASFRLHGSVPAAAWTVTKLRLKPPSHRPAAGGESSLLGGRGAAATKTASKAETCLNRTDIGFRRCLGYQAVEGPDVQRRTRGTRRAFLAKRLSGFCAFCVDRRF